MTNPMGSSTRMGRVPVAVRDIDFICINGWILTGKRKIPSYMRSQNSSPFRAFPAVQNTARTVDRLPSGSPSASRSLARPPKPCAFPFHTHTTILPNDFSQQKTAVCRRRSGSQPSSLRVFPRLAKLSTKTAHPLLRVSRSLPPVI